MISLRAAAEHAPIPSTPFPTAPTLVVLVVSVLGGAVPGQERSPDPKPAVAGKLDAGLAETTRPRPVFVRMSDQLFARGGDYERFCEQHGETARSVLRARVMKQLIARCESSWRALKPLVSELTETGKIRSLRRFWIINGFACDADAAACKALAARSEVAFVYLQRQPNGTVQHRDRWRGDAWKRARRADLEQAIAMWSAELPKIDPDELVVPWNLERVEAPKAWADGALGRGVVVALLDSGVLVTPALVQALWKNPKEKLDGTDSDGNGYVDDIFGWDFVSDTPLAVGDGAQSHGTMCGGIVAGRPGGEPRTVTGVAPHARLMALRGMGSLRAYEYALANGADVLSMSYMWTRMRIGNYRGVFRTAHEHLAACGVVAVGGAGNFKKTAPAGRQISLPKDIPCVIAAAGILRNGKQAPFSSEGPCSWEGVRFFDDYPPDAPLRKPDVTGVAGGYPVWHHATVRGRKLPATWVGADGIGLVQGFQGNSFSGPHAGGVAALMLSANSELTAWRVKALMESTCLDLGEKGHDLAHGAGLLQAAAAVRAARAAKVER